MQTATPQRTHEAPAAAAAARAGTAVTVVVNANASSAPAGRRLARLLEAVRAAGGDVDLAVTSSLEELADVLRRDDGRRVVLCGGDGSVHAAVNVGVPPRDLALIPCGKANNVARSLGIPVDVPRAAALAVTGAVRPVDLMAAQTPDRRRLVVESVSAGFLAQARVRYHAGNSGDVLAGLSAGIHALASFHPLAAHVVGPDGEAHVPLAQLFVANLPLYEFGLHVAPGADPADATLDVVGIEAPTRRAVIAMVAELRRGTAFAHPGTHRWRAATVELRTGGRTPIVADSLDLGPGPVRLTAVPAALRLVRP